MGIADLINQGPKSRSNCCAVQALINGLDETDSTAVTSAIEKIRAQEPGFSSSWLHKILVSEGHKIGASTLMRHVSKGCSCESK